jgi:hypothetical protein
MDVKFVSIKHLTSPVVDEAEEAEDLAAEEATMLPELVVKEDMVVVDIVSDEKDPDRWLSIDYSVLTIFQKVVAEAMVEDLKVSNITSIICE